MIGPIPVPANRRVPVRVLAGSAARPSLAARCLPRDSGSVRTTEPESDRGTESESSPGSVARLSSVTDHGTLGSAADAA